MSSKVILLCAGGTGGHLFPAEALAAVLAPMGYTIDLATDERGAAYAGSFPARKVHAIPSETVRSRSPLAMARTVWKLGSGTFSAWRMLGRVKPAVVVGFGGYPTVPPLTAANWRKIPTLIHEQNAVMGRANRMLAKRATRIATGFADVVMVESSERGKLVQTGNPMRLLVIEAAKTPYPDFQGKLNLVIFGGSQGAKVMSDIVPAAIGLLDPVLRARLSIVQQARAEFLPGVRDTYATLGVEAEVADFFKDLPTRVAKAHLVIGRSGASTVSELALIGRPSILVPLPGALDQDQAANARVLAAVDGARVMKQTEFTPEALADELTTLLVDPARLAAMAANAGKAAAADAAQRLADLVVKLAGR